MFSRYLELVILSVALLGCVGCQTAPKDIPPPAKAAPEQLLLGKLAVEYPAFRTLEDLKTVVKPLDQADGLFLFEKREAKVAVWIQTWGSGDHWNAVIIYMYDAFRQQWVPRAVWDTETRRVRVTFSKRSGMIEARSGGGTIIFQANIAALAANRSRDW